MFHLGATTVLSGTLACLSQELPYIFVWGSSVYLPKSIVGFSWI